MGATNTNDGCPIGWETWAPNPENCIKLGGDPRWGGVIRMKASIKEIYNNPALSSDQILEAAAAEVAAQREPAAQDLPTVYTTQFDEPPPVQPPGVPYSGGASVDVSVLLDKSDPNANIFTKIVGAALPIVGGALLGPAGAALGAAAGGAIAGGSQTGAAGPGGGAIGGSGQSIADTGWMGTSFAPGVPSTGSCASGCLYIGGKCVCPGDAWPGGAPFVSTPGGGAPATSAGGAPYQTSLGFAMSPSIVSSARRRCMPGWILGRDDLCYQKGTITRKFRKWKPNKPYVSRAQYRLITRADRQRDKILNLAKKAGLHASKSKPRPSNRRISKAEAARVLAGK